MSYLRPVGWKQHVGGMVVDLCLASGVSAVALYALKGGRVRNFRSVVQGIVRRDLMFMGFATMGLFGQVYTLHVLLMDRQCKKDINIKKNKSPEAGVAPNVGVIPSLQPPPPNSVNSFEVKWWLLLNLISQVKIELRKDWIEEAVINLSKATTAEVEKVQTKIPGFLQTFPGEEGRSIIVDIIQNLQDIQPGAGEDDSQEIGKKIELLQASLV